MPLMNFVSLWNEDGILIKALKVQGTQKQDLVAQYANKG